jgi:hypothetical protein
VPMRKAPGRAPVGRATGSAATSAPQNGSTPTRTPEVERVQQVGRAPNQDSLRRQAML